MLSAKPWRVEPIACFVAALFFCIFFGALISVALRHSRVSGFAGLDDFGNVFVTTFAFQGMVWILGPVFLRLQQIKVRDALGPPDRRWARAMLVTLASFGVVLPAVWLIQGACGFILTKLGHPPDDQLAVQLIKKANIWWMRAYLGGFAVVIAPVAEEFVFRGLLYPLIKQYGRPRLALFSVSFLFALIHLDLPTFLPLFALALALTWLYEKTDCLLAPMLLHALFNLANLTLLLLNHFDVLPVTK